MIYVVLGTKAQLIKMAPVMVRLKDTGVPYRFIHTGQHRETMDDMLEEFGLRKPDVVLYDGPDIVSPPQMFIWVLRILFATLRRRGRIFGSDRSGILLVHGDTFSTLLGALMGRLARLHVGHVESGLRSFDLFHPFPEELTRLLVFRLSHVLYCPGAWAIGNVEGVRREKVDTHTNTVVDTLKMALALPRRRDHVPGEPFGLVSLHRYENIFRREVLDSLLKRLEAISEHKPLLCVMHPPTEQQLRKFGFYERLQRNPRIELRPRYTYFDFVSLVEATDFIITDGGGIQEESSYLGVPCLLMRKATERREGLGENVVLSEYDSRVIEDFVLNCEQYRRPRRSDSVSASEIIVEHARRFTGPGPG